jgi:hypothetical protein
MPYLPRRIARWLDVDVAVQLSEGREEGTVSMAL